MIYLDPDWAKNKELDAFQALVLACIVAGYDKYESIFDLFVKKVDGELISETIDFLADKDWIALDKKSGDVYTLSEKGRYHYGDHQKRPTRTARSKRQEPKVEPFTPPTSAEVIPYMESLIKACGYHLYAETWAKVMARDWFLYYNREDIQWTIKNKAAKSGRSPMKDWMASCRLWVTYEDNNGEKCRFRRPHPTDPLHPENKKELV